MSRAGHLLAAHWYAPVFVFMAASVWLLARSPTFMASGGEAALLADLCLTAPVLYIVCYGQRQPLRKTVIRALGIVCAGVWLASWLIPESRQFLLPEFAPLRWVGLFLITMFEVRLLIAATRIAFSDTATPKKLMGASGVPEWVARLMLWEARIWRRLWQLIGGRDKPRL